MDHKQRFRGIPDQWGVEVIRAELGPELVRNPEGKRNQKSKQIGPYNKLVPLSDSEKFMTGK